ncbi:hypothetical protein K491DRAFT_760380 [Lophiostoma macrostomum CBS 122681]|uniref:Uncharacterized protein n=1 Tax=Lophiostoma macrostomum CBS 122681 TaxID=1314788 RepID=A0A6A6T1N6_9PLEO|nr:hypothetical protein K491DRAFT_760380 [Lophiostoma macrostomum CBS 122681]
MATQPLRSDANVRLRDEADYRRWINQLQSLCMAHNIWPQVDPDSTTVPLKKPTSSWKAPLYAVFKQSPYVLNRIKIRRICWPPKKPYKVHPCVARRTVWRDK